MRSTPTATPSIETLSSATPALTASPTLPSAAPASQPLASLPAFATAAEADAYGRQQFLNWIKDKSQFTYTYVDGSNCPFQQSCVFARRSFTGIAAAYFGYATHGANYGGALLFIYVFDDSVGWHFMNAQGTQNLGAPGVGTGDQVWLSAGCANVRDVPALSGHVVECLANATLVQIDQGPTFADGHLWWHLHGRGWMVHDFLVPHFVIGGIA